MNNLNLLVFSKRIVFLLLLVVATNCNSGKLIVVVTNRTTHVVADLNIDNTVN